MLCPRCRHHLYLPLLTTGHRTVSDTTTQNLPKQELLKKLLAQTTSDNDNIALMAIRKANSLLAAANWDWEKLIDGKIRVAADPFSSLSRPPEGPKTTHTPTAPFRPQPIRPKRQHPPKYQAPPPPPPPPKPAVFPTIGSQHANKYANYCFVCGVWTDQSAGFIFKPADHNTNSVFAKSRWAVVCKSCNNAHNISVAAAPAKGHGGPAKLADLV